MEKKDDFRHERGYLPFHSKRDDGKKVTTDVLFAATGRPSKVKIRCAG